MPLPAGLPSGCASGCAAALHVHPTSYPSKEVRLPVHFFNYKRPAVKSVFPLEGPEQGGTLVSLTVQDYPVTPPPPPSTFPAAVGTTRGWAKWAEQVMMWLGGRAMRPRRRANLMVIFVSAGRCDHAVAPHGRPLLLLRRPAATPRRGAPTPPTLNQQP